MANRPNKQGARADEVGTPSLQDLEHDLRTIWYSGFRAALGLPLPAISRLTSVRAAATRSLVERDLEIERLLRVSIENLGDHALAKVSGRYLGLDSRADRKERLAEAAVDYGIAKSGVTREPVSFRRIRNDKLEPMLARELLKQNELGQSAEPQASATKYPEAQYEELFEPCPEGRGRLAYELSDAQKRGSSVWWPEGSSGWFGNYFAFWYKILTTDCDEVQITRDQGHFGAERFDLDPSLDGLKDKLALIESSWFHTDPPVKALYCGITNWGFALEWAKDNADALLDTPLQPSVFGVTDRVTYPGIAAVHTLMQSSDGYLIFALRSTKVDYYPLTWSASFEEAISLDARETGPRTGDATVLDTIIGGLHEEWGIHASAIAGSTLLAVGREYVRTSPKRLDLASAVLTSIRLSIDLDSVWRCLDDRGKVRDLDEHLAWVGVRFASRADLLELLKFTRGRAEGKDLFTEFAKRCPACDVRFYPSGRQKELKDRGLMPTSPARLYLGSRWFQM
jgi:hypothetical protein